MFKTNKEGDRTSPEFEGEKDFFIPVGIILLEIEECSCEDEGMTTLVTSYRRENVEKWK